MKRRFLGDLASLGLIWAGLALSAPADARVEERLAYSKSQSFQAALRFLRVDHGYAVLEKDAESGYLLFEYPKRESGYTQGSIQVVDRGDTVAVIVQLPSMPSYHERMLIEGLLKKIREDYGAPPQKKAPEKPNPEPAPDEHEPSPPDDSGEKKGDDAPPEAKPKPK